MVVKGEVNKNFWTWENTCCRNAPPRELYFLKYNWLVIWFKSAFEYKNKLGAKPSQTTCRWTIVMSILWNSSIVHMYSSSVLDKRPSWCRDSRRITYPQVRTVQEKKLLDRSLDVTSRKRNGNSIFWRNFKLVRIVYDFSTYSRTPVTRTLKGNEKQFKLARFRVIGIDCKIQFAMLNLIDTNFSALRCIVKCKFAIGEKQRLHFIFCDLVLSLLQII